MEKEKGNYNCETCDVERATKLEWKSLDSPRGLAALICSNLTRVKNIHSRLRAKRRPHYAIAYLNILGFPPLPIPIPIDLQPPPAALLISPSAYTQRDR